MTKQKIVELQIGLWTACKLRIAGKKKTAQLLKLIAKKINVK